MPWSGVKLGGVSICDQAETIFPIWRYSCLLLPKLRELQPAHDACNISTHMHPLLLLQVNLPEMTKGSVTSVARHVVVGAHNQNWPSFFL